MSSCFLCEFAVLTQAQNLSVATQLAQQQQRAMQREAARLQEEAAVQEIIQQPLLLRSRSQQVQSKRKCLIAGLRVYL